MKVYGAIEGGGTKFNCMVASGPEDILEEIRIPTTKPEETLAAVIDFFNKYEEKSGEKLVSFGVACFGPVDINPSSPTFGSITTTPKAHWAKTPITASLKNVFNIPIAFEIDVNGAAIGEARWGAAKGLKNFVYYTIGTGIGGGAMVNGQMLHGLMHPEMGHMVMPNIPGDDFKGVCPFHDHCLEAMATGPSIEKRWGVSAEELPPEHPAWELEAEYIAAAMQTTICVLSPERIILGGGVMNQLQLFPMVREKTLKRLNGYIRKSEILEDIEHYIVPPGLGNSAGILGALAMAMDVVEQDK